MEEEFEIEELQWAAVWNNAERTRELLENGADAARAMAGLRTFRKETRDSALATLYAAGAFAPNADAIAETCGEALEGIARGETTALKAELQKAGASAANTR